MKERKEMMRMLIGDYDREVYYPAIKALQEECEASEEGHGNGKYHENGLGCHWFYCGKCGGRYKVEQHAEYILNIPLEDD